MVRNEDIERMKGIGTRLESELRDELKKVYNSTLNKKGRKKEDFDEIDILLSFRGLINSLANVIFVNGELNSRYMKSEYEYLKYASLLMNAAENISANAYYIVFQEIHIESEVEKELKEAIEGSDEKMANEAKEISLFLKAIPVYSWGQEDSGQVDVKEVKLVSEEEYQKIMDRKEKSWIYELTSDKFQKIKICYELKTNYRPNEEVKEIQERLSQRLGKEYIKLIGGFRKFFMDRKIGTYYICILSK